MTGRLRIDADLVRRLVAGQFPQWAHLPVRPVTHQGWDNQTFRLGPDMSVRLPSAEAYTLAIEKEHRWLPVLAPRLPLPVPVPLAKGEPDAGYPYPWSVYRWLDGTPARRDTIGDLTEFAVSVARFLTALQRIDPTGGPGPGQHCWYRGGPLATYDGETRRAIEQLDGRVPGDLATEIWATALGSSWDRPPVWFHGDIAWGNLLVRDGALAAVIDFGTSGVGDPACDTVLAWTLLSGESRAAFRAELGVDEATWARGRGWALWKALITYGQPESAYVLDQLFTT
jgi:aminoglycoside phosphotransferase (APT) family kinase protein